MSSLKYVGPTAQSSRDLVNGSYVTNLLATNLSQATVNSLISTALSPYATRTYVDQQDALNANKTYVDNGDSTRLHLSQRNVPNGVAGLDATDRIDPARLPDISTQRFPSPYWSPAAYNATTVNTITEGALYTCAIADPGYTYKLLIFGVAHTTIASDTGEYPVINVRLGSTTGPIIASGYGLAEQNLPARTVLTTPNTYTGGADQPLSNHPGNPPGGGACSGGSSAIGAPGAIYITPSGVSAPAIYSSTKIVSVPLTYQAALTGPQNLFVRLKCSGSVSPVTATTTKPSLWITPIPV